MKVAVVLCLIFIAAVNANPQFRALRARASGLGGGGTPPALPSAPVAPAQPAASPMAAPQTNYQPQPIQYQQFQPQPQMYQPQQFRPQFQQYQPAPMNYYPAAPFSGFQPVQG